MARFIAGFIVGTMLVAFLAIWKEAQTIEPSDLVKSYEKGFQDALDAERPSERLEYVCAALWFKGEKND